MISNFKRNIICNSKFYKGDTNNMDILTWEVREERNLTLKNLSELTGISKSTLNNIENGRTSPTLKQLELIAIALNVRITDLFLSKYK